LQIVSISTPAGVMSMADVKKQAEAMAKANPQLAAQIKNADMSGTVHADLSEDGNSLSIESSKGKQGTVLMARDAS